MPGSEIEELRPDSSRRASAIDRLRSLISPWTLNVRSGICGLPPANLVPPLDVCDRLWDGHREDTLSPELEGPSLEVEDEVDDGTAAAGVSAGRAFGCA